MSDVIVEPYLKEKSNENKIPRLIKEKKTFVTVSRGFGQQQKRFGESNLCDVAKLVCFVLQKTLFLGLIVVQ